MPKPQLNALTGARGIAAWFVVLYHVRDAFGPEVPAGVIAFLSKGYLAVDLFFILSGFVMWLNYGAHFERDGLRAAPGFLWRRLARIYPLHCVILGAMTAFVLLLMATGRHDEVRYPITELPLHILLIQNWGLTGRLSWNDPSWSISTEWGAYLILPLVALALTRWKRSISANIGLIMTLCAGLALFMAAQGAATLGDDISNSGLIRCLFEFFIGVLMCSIWQQASPAQHRLLLPTAIFIILCAGTLWVSGTGSESATIPALFAAVVYSLAQTSGWKANPLSTRAAVHMGDISYSTYLVHFFLWILFKIAFVVDPATVSLPLMLSFIVLTYVASEALYRLVENPGRKWMQGHSPAFTRRLPLSR